MSGRIDRLRSQITTAKITEDQRSKLFDRLDDAEDAHEQGADVKGALGFIGELLSWIIQPDDQGKPPTPPGGRTAPPRRQAAPSGTGPGGENGTRPAASHGASRGWFG